MKKLVLGTAQFGMLYGLNNKKRIPLKTIRSIINWKDSIKNGTMLLRDIVDLEATYDMSDIGETKIDDTLKLIEGATEKKDKPKSMKWCLFHTRPA